MQESMYYIGNRNAEGRLIVLCKDGEWRLYRECEENWSQVLVLPSPEAYRLRDGLASKSNILNPHEIHCYCNSRNRQIFALMDYNESQDKWFVKGKCLADGFGEACQKFGVD
jgi:hypothetical protein